MLTKEVRFILFRFDDDNRMLINLIYFESYNLFCNRLDHMCSDVLILCFFFVPGAAVALVRTAAD